ncbi:hypothetical protein NCX79_002008 [Salmonella enterica]|uniref:Uncharacterized protein n=1 Tax=Salmonella muenchen TaxID=596 RepID=A0A735FRV9_SALMU|nr:hypothetical protein [Salmonella enterica]EKR1611056.1 hypothetical protein [Salmonella enterica subsp. enterica serovar Muenchen]EEU8951271.1 hypothetical protein [Salmonella enterica]EJH2292243.1 hypothetical protein [Salmonella enterica]EJJ9918336.1 hypothetical protein [Salmonella enterica]
MSYFEISHAVRKVLKGIDESELEKCIDKCLYEEQSYYLQDFRLYDCGSYVTQKLSRFEKAVTALRLSKSSKKREEARYTAQEAGRNLTDAFLQMRAGVSEVEAEEVTFSVDEQNFLPTTFSERLSVRINYSWRIDQNADWQHGSITFSYLAKEEPSYFSVVPTRKVSVARHAQEKQENLYRAWEHLRAICKESVHKYLKEGRDGSLIPKTFTVKNLNNFGANFWNLTGA